MTMLINVKKLTRNEILHYFSSVAIQDPKIIRGEFIVDIDKVYVKTFVKNTIFTFNYQIKSSYRVFIYLFIFLKKKAPSDLLVVKK